MFSAEKMLFIWNVNTSAGDQLQTSYISIIEKYGRDKTQVLMILRDIQNQFRYISDEAITLIAEELDISRLQVEGCASFYHFFSTQHRGRYTIYLNTSATSEMSGVKDVIEAFEEEIGIKFGEVTADQNIGLFKTSCIGMCDQEPAAIINDQIFPNLTKEKVKQIVREVNSQKDLAILSRSLGDGKNQHPLIHAEVHNNIRHRGDILLSDYVLGVGLNKAMDISSLEVIENVKKSNLRGRGGAGFPTGQKWGFCRSTESDTRYVICNADEGEPGTFKDRVLLTEFPEMIFEGMIIAGYAIEAKFGILYLRGEYAYLKNYLENVLSEMRANGYLGRKILNTRFSFDIQIKMGAGAYICGEESALIESAEGKRGQPRNRPPFPVTSGYLHKPTIVNNPETFSNVTKIMTHGPDWFKSFGTAASSGTKLLSVAGDCEQPGIYEVPWGITVQEVLDLCGAKNTLAVQVGGPSGVCVSERQFNMKIAYEELGTGGAFTVFNKTRDLFSIIHNHMEFFVHETCGFCVPCRAGNTLLLQSLEKIMIGNGTTTDLQKIKELGHMVKSTSRCGLGQTSPNPLLTTLQNFAEFYQQKVRSDVDMISQFDMQFAIADSCKVAHRSPNLKALEKGSE